MGFHHHYVHGPRLIPRLMGSASGATALLGAEADGLSIDFTDASLVVRDTTTTSNAWNGANGDVQTFWRDRSFTSYSSPSPKITRDSSGLYTFRPHNRVPMSEGFALAAWTKTRSSISSNTTTAPDGTSTADTLIEDGTAAQTHYVEQTVTTGTGTVVTYSVYCKAKERTWVGIYVGTTTKGSTFDLANGLASGTIFSAPLATEITSVGSGWYRCSITFEASAATEAVRVYIAEGSGDITYSGDAASGIYIWGAMLNAGPTALTYTKTQAHNLILQSQTLGSVGSANITITSNDATAPDGTVTADLVYPTTTGSSRRFEQSVTVPAGTLTFSIYAKYANIRWLYVFKHDGSTIAAWFDVQNGAVGTVGSGYSASVTAVGNGWYRFSCTGTAAAGASFTGYIGLSSADNSISVTANGTDGIHLWGAQVELASSPGKYVASTTAAVYSANYDLPREWNSSGVCQGLLQEEARTNICLYARDLSQSNYTKTSATAALTATGVDGVANTASTLTASASNGTAVQNITSASAARSLSMFVKRRTGTGTVTISHSATTGSELVTNGTFATDLTGWTLGTGGAGSNPTWDATGKMSVVRAGGDYGTAVQSFAVTAGKIYKLSYTADNAAAGVRVGTSSLGNQLLNLTGTGTQSGSFVATTTPIYVGVLNSNTATVLYDDITVKEVAETDITSSINSSTWTRVSVTNETITNPCVAIKLATSGDAIDVDYCQSEAGAFITSPIYTGSASVTRAIDNITMSPNVMPSMATAGTWYAKASKIVSGSSFGPLIEVHESGGITNRVPDLSMGTGTSGVAGYFRCDYQTSSVNQAALGHLGSYPTAGDVHKVATSYAANDFAVSVDGEAVGTDTSGTVGSYAVVGIGVRNGSSALNGHIRQLMALPRAMTDAELIAVSTP
jgi:hypothetical protein